MPKWVNRKASSGPGLGPLVKGQSGNRPAPLHYDTGPTSTSEVAPALTSKLQELTLNVVRKKYVPGPGSTAKPHHDAT